VCHLPHAVRTFKLTAHRPDSVIRENRFLTDTPTGTLLPLPLPFLIQPAVQFKRSADQRQVRKCLREIAQMLARWTQLSGKETQVIRVTQRFFQEKSSSFHLTAPGQTFDQPEGTDAEGSFGPDQAILCLVPIDQ
jgi:hypothetical protein